MESWFGTVGQALLRRELASSRMRQREAARQLGISQGYLSNLLHGKRRPSDVLEDRIRDYLLRGAAPPEGDLLLRDALMLAARSPDFRQLLHAAIRLHMA